MAGEFQASGRNRTALFTLKLHRGEGMLLLAMNWKKGRPPNDFVGFGIECFRVVSEEAKQGKTQLALARPPRAPAETACKRRLETE